MPRDLKPIPRNIVQVEQAQITPYLASQGKPDSDEGTVFSRNRGKDLSFKGNKIKDISIGLEDIDGAIQYYFDNIIKPNVIQNGNRVAVPIIFGDAEKWKSVQNDGFYRDKDGKIMAPLIMYKRTNVEKNRTLGNKLDSNQAHLFNVFETRYNQRNQYDKFSILNNRIPSKQYYVSVVPDYVTITYECVLLTNYVEQNNKLIEAIEYASDSYWGDANRWQFRTSLDSFGITNNINTGEDRVSSTTVSLKVNGYLIADSINQHLSDTNMHFSPAQIIFTMETSDNAETFAAINKQAAPKTAMGGASISDSYNVNITNIAAGVTNEVSIYLSTSKTKYASTVTTNTATFSATFLAAPLPLSPTDKNSFTYFVNGQLVDINSVTDFVDNGNGTCTLTINTGLLQYTLVSTDQVIIIGKFQ